MQPPLPELVDHPVVPGLGRGGEAAPAPVQGSLVQALPGRVAHRVGQVAGAQSLLEHLGTRLCAQRRSILRAAGERIGVEARRPQPGHEIVNVAELALRVGCADPAMFVGDRLAQCCEIAVVVQAADHAEPQVPVAPDDATDLQPRLVAGVRAVDARHEQLVIARVLVADRRDHGELDRAGISGTPRGTASDASAAA